MEAALDAGPVVGARSASVDEPEPWDRQVRRCETSPEQGVHGMAPESGDDASAKHRMRRTAGSACIERMFMVGARGDEPPVPTPRIVVAGWIVEALHGAP